MCTRVLHSADDNSFVITGRNMDWKGSTYSDLWVFLPGLVRNGGDYGDKTFTWTSKYSSVVLSGRAMEGDPRGCTCDGINSEGLVANLQVLDESDFPSDGDKKMTIAAWTQYVLDRFATVQEVVDALKKEEFIITTPKIPGTDRSAKLHLAVSDASADSAIFEYEKNKLGESELKIYHGKEHKVLTNDPFYHEHLDKYEEIKNEIKTIQESEKTNKEKLEEIDKTLLPGGKNASARFIRASYYLGTAAEGSTQKLRQAIADTFSIIRNAAAPSAYRNDDDPISETIWSTVIDHKNLVYYFADALSPNLWWVDLKSENLKKKIENAKKKALKIKLPYSEEDFNSGEYKDYFGDITHLFEEAEPFAFVYE